jgi:methionyl-tRNA formyltransferase
MSLTLPSTARNPCFVLFGNLCHFTTVFLREALDAGINVAAIVLPGLPSSDVPHRVRSHKAGPGTFLPTSGGDQLTDIALSASIPVYRVGRLTSRQAIALLKSFGVDCILSVCFPRRVPGSLIEADNTPALNVHPSMLPKLRGPDPMFWTFHDGTGRSGVTIHHLTSRLDAGPVAAQTSHEFVDGISEHELESELAGIAVRLLDQLQTAMPQGQLPAAAQSEHEATYAGFPTESDYRIDRTWNARRAFNFASGLVARRVPLVIDLDNSDHVITNIHAYGETRRIDCPGVWIRMADGYIAADVVPLDP